MFSLYLIIFVLRHSKLEEHTQHIMSLAAQYAFGGVDHFNPEEVKKVPQILLGNRSLGMGTEKPTRENQTGRIWKESDGIR